MKRETLTEFGLTKEQIDQIMNLNGKDIERQKEQLEQAQMDVTTLKKQIDAANKQIESFKSLDIEGIKKSADEYKVKYEQETAELRKQLDEKDFLSAAEVELSDVMFSSKGAKKTFYDDLKKSEVKLENGSLKGFSEFLEAYKKQDPESFKIDDVPKVVYKASGGNPGDVNNDVRSIMGLPVEK